MIGLVEVLKKNISCKKVINNTSNVCNSNNESKLNSDCKSNNDGNIISNSIVEDYKRTKHEHEQLLVDNKKYNEINFLTIANVSSLSISIVASSFF